MVTLMDKGVHLVNGAPVAAAAKDAAVYFGVRAFDVLVCAAGISSDGLVSDFSRDEMKRTMEVNLGGVINAVRAVVPAMISAGEGAIVALSSVWGQAGASCESVYSASKGAVNAFVMSLAKELGPSGIRVNCVSPGVIDTDMNRGHSEEAMRRLEDETPLCRIGKPEEVAEAFETLEKQGKVRYFGVSNENAMQMELLNHYCGGRIVADQLQFSIAHCDIIDSGLNVNVHNDAGTNRDGGVLEYCRLKNITIQAWSPFQYGMFEGVFLGSEKFPELNKLIGELAEKYQVTDNAIAVAWILRHPARIQTIVGSTNKKRVEDICKASDVRLTREEWYALYMAAGKQLP